MRITVAAKPEPFAFDPSGTAVIAVDLQNDFGAKGGYVDSFMPILHRCQTPVVGWQA